MMKKEISISAATAAPKKKVVVKRVEKPKSGKKSSSDGLIGGKSNNQRGRAAKLKPKTLATEGEIASFKSLAHEEQETQIKTLVQLAQGERPFHLPSVPTASSTALDRGHAAADIAAAAKAIGIQKVLKSMGVLTELERMLAPDGIRSFAVPSEDIPTGSMPRVMSAQSLASMDSFGGQSDSGSGIIVGDSTATIASSERGRTTPAAAREGCLMVLRALCETCGRSAAPYVIPLLGATLDESGSSQGMIRDASEDTCRAMIQIVNPLSTHYLICPVLFEALNSPEWRVKCNALERLSQLAAVAPRQVCDLLPKLIPLVTRQVWDTKPQVSKAAGACLLAACKTNVNPDIQPSIPCVVQAIVKPADTVTAIEELMATTFVSTVDASTLALLCPVLSRGLKEKLALHKRATCLVIKNMSRLVETPDAVAPFGPLLVPELKKVAENVQFEEIRDAALEALQTLTKALGHSSIEEAVSSVMAIEQRKVELEQQRIKEEREAIKKKEEEISLKEIEERRQWKEAQEAMRQLEEMRIKEEEEKKNEENKKALQEKRSTKSEGGKCKACGLKKCRKDCLFRT